MGGVSTDFILLPFAKHIDEFKWYPWGTPQEASTLNDTALSKGLV